jgi:hypothetical protein
MNPAPSQAEATLPFMAAAELQDHLMTASNDLDRLQTLLADACDTLMARFCNVSSEVRTLIEAGGDGAEDAGQAVISQLGGAVTALQFQDMASQLIIHTHKRLRTCADQIARASMGDDEDGEALVEDTPLRANPVTQAEMDAGSIELF